MQIPILLLTQTVEIFPYLGKTPKGDKYDTSFESLCRFESFKKRYKKPSCEEFVANGRVFLPANDNTVSLEINTKMIIDGKTYNIIEITIHRGFSLSHVEAVLI